MTAIPKCRHSREGGSPAFFGKGTCCQRDSRLRGNDGAWFATMLNKMFLVFLITIALLICVTDFRKMIIPDWINALLAATGAIVSVFVFRQNWTVVLGAAVLTGLSFMTVAGAYRGLRGVSGLGMGDIKFLAAASTWIGVAGLPWLLLFACIGGLAHVLVRHLAGHEMERMTRIPFGPYLSAGLVLVWSLGLSL
jgi:leader peptidase (prepilin peptidase) / N-methyltransferase